MRDRKSTRLNSSHQIISYAVFCLKKKKMPPHVKTMRPRAIATRFTRAGTERRTPNGALLSRSATSSSPTTRPPPRHATRKLYYPKTSLSALRSPVPSLVPLHDEPPTVPTSKPLTFPPPLSSILPLSSSASRPLQVFLFSSPLRSPYPYACHPFPVSPRIASTGLRSDA